MQMQFQDVSSLLSVIIVLCFSFCFLVVTFWFKNAKVLPRLLGYSFFSAFLLSFASIFVNDYELSAAFSQTAEPLMLLLILLLLAAKPDKTNNMLFNFIILIMPVTLLFTAVFLLPARSFLAQQLTSTSASVIILAAVFYLLKNEKGDMNHLFWSMLLLFISSFAQYYLSLGITVFIAPLFKAGAYFALLVFFYRVFLKSQLDKVESTEKKLAVINRSIEHEVKKRMQEVEKVNQKLINISKTDSMSKVMNKSALLDSIEYLINGKSESEFSILMFDIDNFKIINDTLGHVIGDKCIKTLSATIRNNIRDIDLIGRYGGDEFIIVLPGTGTNQAIIIAERFRKLVDSSESPHYTISIGIATYPNDGANVKALIEAADEGLYRSKRKGKNSVSYRSSY